MSIFTLRIKFRLFLRPIKGEVYTSADTPKIEVTKPVISYFHSELRLLKSYIFIYEQSIKQLSKIKIVESQDPHHHRIAVESVLERSDPLKR